MRDNSVLETIEEWRVCDVQQIQRLFFSFPTGQRKAQERLKLLYTAKKVERWRGADGYVYGEKAVQWEHRLLLNWLRLREEVNKASWEEIHYWKYEYQVSSYLRPDSFVGVRNTVTGLLRFFFVEAECKSDRNDFGKKVRNYNKLYEDINAGQVDQWWVKLVEKFPPIYIIALTCERKQKILRTIQENNKHGLRFHVNSLDEVRRCL